MHLSSVSLLGGSPNASPLTQARTGRVSVRLNEDSLWSRLASFALSYIRVMVIEREPGCGSGRTAGVQTH